MSATSLSNTLTLPSFGAKAAPKGPSAADRLQAWLAGKNRARVAAAARALLARYAPAGGAEVLTLDCDRGTPAGRVARLRGIPDGSVDTVISVGALADAADVAAVLAHIKRVLRPGGRLLFVEPVAAQAGTRLRRVQRTLDRMWRTLAGSVNAPRDLWNDLKAARFGALAFEQLALSGLAGLPVPYLVGEAVMPAAPRAAAAPPRRRAAGVPALTWREPAFAFFG